jgi:DNA mismatch repair ATPase MutS
MDALGRLDLLLAKAALARELGGVKPKITDRALSFTDMVHPAIDHRLKTQGEAFTPLSIALSPGAAVLMGANMGGKSVCLKTLALNVYLTHCGLFPFARAAQVPFFDQLCLVRGEGEDGREGLSSFGGELMAADAAARAVQAGFCLVLFDEFARGTNPAEAVKLQQGALSYFGASGSVCLFVTHYAPVAARAARRYLVRGIRDLDLSEGRRMIAAGADKLSVLRRFMDYGVEEITDAAVPQKALAVAELLEVEEGLLSAIRQEYAVEGRKPR